MMDAGRWKLKMNNVQKFSFFILCFVCLFSCKNETRITSENISNKEERIKILQKHVKYFSEVEDAQFDLFNVNGFGNNFSLVPGSSNLDYKFVVKVKTEDIDKWRKDFLPVPHGSKNEEWIYPLKNSLKSDSTSNNPRPNTSSFVKDGVYMIIDYDESFIFKRIYQD